MTPRDQRFAIAANRGELGGGEVMLLRLAVSARELGLAPVVVTPRTPDALAQAARDEGVEVVAIEASDRVGYLRNLRRWHSGQAGARLWCNGLLPALATAGRPGRVVHLHQAPTRRQRAAEVVATRRADAVVVPSADMGRRVRHDLVLPNWTGPLEPLPTRKAPGRLTIGYLGRLQTDKGVDVLARAVELLLARGLDLDLVVAGDHGFGRAQDLARVEAALARLNGRVHRLGHVDRHEFFGRVDLAVFPSVWAEPFGLVVTEAMGLNVPFVVSDAGALPEVAGHQHPWVARAGDAADLARVVEQALTCSADEMRGVVSRARERWQREFSPEAGTARLAVVLRELGYPVVHEVQR